MTNSKAVREQLLKQAGAVKMPDGRWRLGSETWERDVVMTCKLCGRRSFQPSCNDLNCPFCGSAMYEVRK